MTGKLSATLEMQNPWWTRAEARVGGAWPLRRAEFPVILARLLADGAPQVLLTGPRQVGKSVLLRQLADELLEQGWPRDRLTLCDLEDRRYERAPTLGEVVDAAVARSPVEASATPHVFLLDEVHASADWATWLKQLHERRVGRFVVTDSAAALLKAGERDVGGGRFHELSLRFLSFPDFERLRQQGLPPEVAQRVSPAEEFDAYLERGGSPAHLRTVRAAEAWQRLRIDIVELAIGKDLAELAHRRDVGTAQRLFAALAGGSGSVFDATQRARDFGCKREQVNDWVEDMIATRLLERLDRLERSLRKGSRAQPKLFAADPGIAAALAPSADPLADEGFVGGLFETAIHRHLAELAERCRARLHFFRPDGARGPELDFVLHDESAIVAFEAKSSRSARSDGTGALLELVRRLPAGMGEGAVAVLTSRSATATLSGAASGSVLAVPAWELCHLLGSAGSVPELVDALRGGGA